MTDNSFITYLTKVLESKHRISPYEEETKRGYSIEDNCINCDTIFKPNSVLMKCCSDNCKNIYEKKLLDDGNILLEFLGDINPVFYFGNKLRLILPYQSLYKPASLPILMSVLEKLEFSPEDIFLVYKWTTNSYQHSMNSTPFIFNLSNKNGSFQLSRTLKEFI